jgi:hypothetical protein
MYHLGLNQKNLETMDKLKLYGTITVFVIIGILVLIYGDMR